MKKLVFVLVAITMVFSSVAQKRTPDISKERYYTIQQGSLNFHATRVFFGDGIYFGETKTDTMRYYNAGLNPVHIHFDELPEHLTCEAIPEAINPGEEGVIVIHYNTVVKNVYGPTFDYFYAQTDDAVSPRKRLIVSPDIYEDFSTLTDKERKHRPKIHVDKKKIDLGTMTEGEEVFHVFTISNNGERDLLIRAVKASCGCTTTDFANSVIKPGESAEMEVTFRSVGKKGKQNHRITIVTNDPNNPVSLLSLQGKVVKSN
jgi:hypothetical protein